MVYNTVVRPQLEYASPPFGTHTQKAKYSRLKKSNEEQSAELLIILTLDQVLQECLKILDGGL